MKWPSPERAAQAGIGILFIAILRTVAEYYRLRWSLGPEAGLKAFEPFIPGLLLAVIGAMTAVALYFARRFRLVVWAAGIVIGGLILYKAIFIPI
ncbi:MAG TPA: hypothetical protein VMH05_18845 [Bryobacteraceae bacterium]|nr:hypothetical protein [Bryobacteraceae bacterium]